jgi:hypothetical protein
MEYPEKKEINRYIEEFFPMDKGEIIKDPTEEILLGGNLKVKRIGLKHIVESRKDDGYSREAIKDMVSRAIGTVLCPELDIANTNKKYPDSRIAGKAYPCEDRALLVIYQPDKEGKVVYNLYYREISRFKKMK